MVEPGAIVYPAAVLSGLILGSFFNVLVQRLPRHESIVRPGSRCPACGRPIRPRDNIPLLSFILLGGRCRDCRGRIPLRYLLVEALTPLVFAGLVYRFGVSLDLLPALFLASVLLVAFFADLETGLIPNRLTYPAMVLSVLLVAGGATALSGGRAESIGGLAVMGGGLFLLHLVGPLLLGKETMGLGDVKLAAVMGLVLGWRLSLVSLYVAFFLGALVGLGLLLLRRGRRWRKVPFGPFLALGGGAAIWWGREILRAYLALIGG